MRSGALVLVAGQLDPPDWWGRQRLSLPMAVAPAAVLPADGSSHAASWLAAMAGALHDAAPAGPLVFVCHGLAGPLIPALANTQRAAGRRPGGYVFVDATLPRPGSPSHLDLLRAADPEAATTAHDVLHAPGATWPPEAPVADHTFWTEPLPPTGDWPDAPCGYVRTGDQATGVGPTAFWARSARARGWTAADGPLADALPTVLAALPG